MSCTDVGTKMTPTLGAAVTVVNLEQTTSRLNDELMVEEQKIKLFPNDELSTVEHTFFAVGGGVLIQRQEVRARVVAREGC